MRWSELSSDVGLLSAVNTADRGQKWDDADRNGTTDDKRNWSNRFADACAAFLAEQFVGALPQARRANLSVYPEPGGAHERSIQLGEGSRKRIDVAVVHPLGGLRIDVSMKGLNFRGQNGNYDHNLTGRTYELEAELRAVRRLQPACMVFALYWLPIQATSDKLNSICSFARSVAHLRQMVHIRTNSRIRPVEDLDGAAVALYAPTQVQVSPTEVIERGVVRCMDVLAEPPRRGRPQLPTTTTVAHQVQRWVHCYLDSTIGVEPDWAPPEEPL